MPDTPPPLPLAPALVQRAWLLLTQAALLLPFVTARDCANGAVADFTGVELYTRPDHLGIFAPLVLVTLVLFVFPYRSSPVSRALAPLGLRAFLAGVGSLLALGAPALLLLFDEVTYHTGWYLHVGGWIALYVALLVGAVVVLARGGGGRPTVGERVAMGALVGAPPLAVVGKLLHDELDAYEILAAFGIGSAMVAPLVLMGLGLARLRADGVPSLPTRVVWWGLVAVTVGLHVVAAASK